MATHFEEDFSSGSWATNWTVTGDPGTGTGATVVAGWGRQNVVGAQTYIQAVADMTAVQDQEFLVKWMASTGPGSPAFGETLFSTVAFRGSGSWRPANAWSVPTWGYYLVRQQNASGIGLRYAKSDGTTVVSGNGFGNIAAAAPGETWWVRIQVEDAILRYRAWEDGDPEPSTWSEHDQSASITVAAGVVQVACSNRFGSTDRGYHEVDDVLVTDIPVTTQWLVGSIGFS